MNDRFGRSGSPNDAVAIPRVWVTFALSIVVHTAALVVLLPRLPGHIPWQEQGETSERLEVELASQRAATPAPPTLPSSAAPSRVTRTIVSPSARARSAPPPPRGAPLALTVTTPQAPPLPPPAPTPGIGFPPALPSAIAAAEASPAVGGDLSSFIAARRRARDEQSTPANDASERHDRIIAANMPGQGPLDDELRKRGGGIFEITRMTFADAEFLFFGWNGDARRRKTQAYEVRLGNDGDIRIAIVRRMIAIIREHDQGDFRWHSWRLHRIVVLSARAEDNAALEDFMLQEFFERRSGTSHR